MRELPTQRCLTAISPLLLQFVNMSQLFDSIQILTSDEIRALIPDMQRLLLLYGSKAAMHYDNFEGMLKWLKSHLEHAEWLGRYQMEFEHGLSL